MLRSRVRTLVASACLPLMACLHALGQYDPSQIMNAMQTRQPGLTLVASHRGEINGAYGENMPENSVGAALNAIYGGIEMVEADVWTTQDHIPYLMHDKTLYRMLQLNEPSQYNPDPNTPPAPTWLAIQGMTLCGGRGITEVANGGTGQCTLSSPAQSVPSLALFMSQILPAQNQQGQTWGGVVLLDIRDQDSLIQSWVALVNNPNVSQQVVFKFSPLVLGLSSVQDLVNLLATSSYYNGNTGNVEHDLAAYMNFQPTYITNRALEQEAATGNPNWAIDDWNNWLANAGSFHRLLTAEVSVKGSPGEFMTADELYQTVASGPLNTVSAYSTYYECSNPSGPQNLPNLPSGSAGFNGYWINDGVCSSLSPSEEESADGIDHRYDYNFITGHTSPNTPNITAPPNFGMIISDNAFVLINYLQGIGQRNLLGSIQPHCNSGSAYPDCDANNQTTYTLCATEGGTCSFTGDRNVAYGGIGSDGNVHYTTMTFTNSVTCNEDTFGDPNPSYVKNCYISPPIAVANTVYCGDEGGTCTYTERAEPWMAANGKAVSASFFLHPGGFACNVSTFWEDPAEGFVKACFYEAYSQYVSPVVGPAGYTFCAGENGSCPFKGPGRIAFGANGNFNYRVLNGGVSCNNETLGPDPAPGYTKSCFYQVITPASGVTDIDLGSGPTGTGGTSTCDIYASGGTPCVAAHSTVRALFGSYSGRLYQVQRASDGTTTDIGTLTPGGYANAAAQDAFCTGTTCTITMIYDQSSYNNNLSIEGPGGTVTTADSGAVANALPITVNGNEAYGVNVTSGVGYRNNATSGVARGASPEGMYMVTSGTNVNNGCCFDYGNAETSASDTGNGHMDALNFGTWCGYPPCSGSGPWVQADLENGQYMGNGSNTADPSISADFATAMLKNNGTSTFALKDGDAQSGGLTTDYSGSLPTVKSGYIPMSLEGAIVLGTGGDNSDWGIGSFFEGAMTSGYPPDATEDAVQANIVAAGYAGTSSPTYGEASSYTGPSDPYGAGPQDGFTSPAVEQPNDIMGSKPALASFNGSLYVAFMGYNASNDLYVTSSSSGSGFPTATRYTNIQMGSAPAMAEFNNQLYVAFMGLNASGDFYVTSSSSGSSFPTATRYTNIQMGSAPALAVFNNQLCAAFQAYDSGHTLHVTCSSDGVTWPTAWQIPNVQIGSAPAMAVYNGVLYVAFRANDPSNDVWIASSSDGVNFSSQVLAGQTMGGNSAPALVVSNGVLYYIYGANDLGNEMLVSASTDGSTWQGPAAYLGIQMGATGPGAAAFGDGISVGFQSNDSRQVLFVTNKATEATSYTGPNDPGGPGPQDAFTSPATEQPNDVMATKPALASFNGSLYAAFQGYNAAGDLYVTSSSSGSGFPSATRYTNLQMGGAPAMAAFNNQLYLAFMGLDASGDLYVTSSSSGSGFPAATRYTNIQMGGAPALAVFNNQLCAAFQAYDVGHTLHVTCSSDGVTWPTAWQIPNVQIGSDPAMTVFNGKLYVAFRANDTTNNAFISSSSDGVNFSSQDLLQPMGGSSAPALVVSNCVLYYIYGANDLGNEMLVMASTDGSTWQGPAAYLGIQMGATGPGAAAFGNDVYVGFQSNDSRNVLYTTSGIGGYGLPAGPCQY